MDASTLLEQARDTITVRRVYGEPVEEDGLTVIPAAAVRGGGGGGSGTTEEGEGGGGGFAVAARPVGAYVIRDGEVEWKPALDVARTTLGWQVVALVSVLTAGAIALRLLR